MAAEANQDSLKSNKDLPLILYHHLPTLNSPLKEILLRHFNVLDPADSPEPASSFLSTRAKSVRALVCLAYTPITAETLKLLPSLELIVASSAGLNHVDLQECRRRGLIITTASTAFAEDVADYAVALLIDVLRRISASHQYVCAGLWPVKGDYPLGFKLGGKRVGIVGLGNIGLEVAKRLEAFGCSISYNSRKMKPSVLYPYYDSVHDLVVQSDVLILSCTLTEETHRMINKDVMAALGKKGVIINVGRGALIDEKELVQFLVRGEIGGAGLDVFENEPDVPRELFELDNVVLSPHHAMFTPESLEAVYELIFTNLKAFFSNKPLQSVFQSD